jgi:hypothetical protein
VQFLRYLMEVSKRGHSARAALRRGDLNSALDDVETAVTTAEQNLDCIDMANPTVTHLKMLQTRRRRAVGKKLCETVDELSRKLRRHGAPPQSSPSRGPALTG